MTLPSVKIEPQAQDLLDAIMQKVDVEIDKSRKIPVSVLLWGPSSEDTSEIAKLRVRLRTKLSSLGHLAKFSEELVDLKSGVSIKAQQLMHAQHFDIVVSLPVTPGSLGEIHDFVGDNRVNKKLLVFLNEEFDNGYSFQSIVATCTTLTYRTVLYKGLGDVDVIEQAIMEEIQRIRELKYFNLGRWM